MNHSSVIPSQRRPGKKDWIVSAKGLDEDNVKKLFGFFCDKLHSKKYQFCNQTHGKKSRFILKKNQDGLLYVMLYYCTRTDLYASPSICAPGTVMSPNSGPSSGESAGGITSSQVTDAEAGADSSMASDSVADDANGTKNILFFTQQKETINFRRKKCGKLISLFQFRELHVAASCYLPSAA